MPNIAKVLREEIQRLAKQQARVELHPLTSHTLVQ